MAGKLEVANHKIIQDNLSCFPNYKNDTAYFLGFLDKYDTTLDTNVNSKCDKARAAVMGNHQKMKKALLTNDGCTAGKLQVLNHKIIMDNKACFNTANSNTIEFNKAVVKYDSSSPNSEDK